MVKKFFLVAIKIYQYIFSSDQGMFATKRRSVCRFYPTCSEYTYQAIDKYGLFHGLLKGAKRVLRCHPLNQGGYDPIP